MKAVVFCLFCFNAEVSSQCTWWSWSCRRSTQQPTTTRKLTTLSFSTTQSPQTTRNNVDRTSNEISPDTSDITTYVSSSSYIPKETTVKLIDNVSQRPTYASTTTNATDKPLCTAASTFKASFKPTSDESTKATTSTDKPTTEAELSTLSKIATSSPLLDIKSVPVSAIAGSFGGFILIVLLTIGLVIFFRKRKRRHASDDTETNDTEHNNNNHSNPAYDAPSADNVSSFSEDSGFGKHDESKECEMMDGEYNTLRLHFPVNNEPQDNTYSHVTGYLTADSTYSHIANSKDVSFDNTYSHMSNVTPGRPLKPQDIDTTYSHLGESCSIKVKVRTEETSDDTYNHAQMNHVRPTADQDDQDETYSRINGAGLKAQVSNAGKQRAKAQEPMHKNAEYPEVNNVAKIIDKGKKQHGDAHGGKCSTATLEVENKYEGQNYFVLEPIANQRHKQAPYDYAVAATPEKDHTGFTVVETDTQHEYAVLEPTTEL